MKKRKAPKQDKLAELEKRIEQLEKREPVVINFPATPELPKPNPAYPNRWPWNVPVIY